MKKNMRKKIRFPFVPLFLSGFLTGMLLPNMAWKLHWQEDTLGLYYMLRTFSIENTLGKTYFLTILSERGSWFLFCAICGFSIFGLPLAVLWSVGMGIAIGAILTMPILQFGFSGGILGLSVLVPHYFFYLPALCIQASLMSRQSGYIWSGTYKGTQALKESAKCWWPSGGTAALLWFLGIVSECFLNLPLLKKIIEITGIF